MRIVIFGMGYVGCVTAACLAKMGHEVCGVDVSPVKVEMINAGHATVVEKGLERLVAQAVRRRKLRASQDPAEGIRGADVSLVCVGTPSARNGEANIGHVLHAAREIGRALSLAGPFHTVAVRSTVPPGTMKDRVTPLLESESGKKAERDFGVCFHPEFLREGSSLADFFRPSLNVLGSCGPRSTRRLAELWRPLRTPLWVTSLPVAELLKYTCNAFHALKVAFANEVGVLARSFGVDSHEVMELFVQDKRLNISPRYLRPGFAFGGPCLPKDLRALARWGERIPGGLPLLSSILDSNARHLRRAVELVLATRKKKIGVLGLTFKSETDDLRESPACALVRGLLGAKKEVRVYDPLVQPARLVGANRAFVEKELPELPRLLERSLAKFLAWSEVLVVAGNRPEFARVAGATKKRKQSVVDLVRLPGAAELENFQRIC